MRQALTISFQNTYARLPGEFYARLSPEKMPTPRLLKLNEDLAKKLQLDVDALQSEAGIEFLSGRVEAEGSEPLAMAYAGHQFGHFVPQLGDGRALLLGEVLDGQGRRYDIQLKGSGRTPFSRRGDGRATLGSVLREYIVSEGMSALGVPSTRALAALLSGEGIMREQVFPGAIFVRVAQSHIRVGTFQFFAARGKKDLVKTLADYVIERHYPAVKEAENPYLALLDVVSQRQANLVAHWMALGFIHGVMNTDNTTLSGETIDYGPCAFMDTYHPDTVYSSIDHHGRYAYGNQPNIALWNMSRLAETLLFLVDANEDKAVKKIEQVLVKFPEYFSQSWRLRMGRKIGIQNTGEEDEKLIGDLLGLMAASKADFTNTFRRLCVLSIKESSLTGRANLFHGQEKSEDWFERWDKRLECDEMEPDERVAAMQKVNPSIIPRNHLVENAIQEALRENSFEAFEYIIDALKTPFVERPPRDKLVLPPEPQEVVEQTFCGT
ncbi:MAG: YdiU family protein [Myxococcota bacterium]|jgi:uncharacterized protein YdiU (UPF0061 family)|nr:YdiU family protein [Myxococcota bacterium]